VSSYWLETRSASTGPAFTNGKVAQEGMEVYRTKRGNSGSKKPELHYLGNDDALKDGKQS
jgi:hypothetical protein